jgi:mRNA-degrading endonuclease toxin of MazEF toxin-antitoxin module
MQRGDIVIVAFPYVTGGGGKNRPALVVQCDRDNQRLSNTIVAMITGNTRYAQTEPTQLLIDPSTHDGQSLRAQLCVRGEVQQPLHRRSKRHSRDDRQPLPGAHVSSG